MFKSSLGETVNEELRRSERELATSLIIATCLDEVDRRYGPNGLSPKIYHGVGHTLEVVDATSLLAELAIANDNIQPDDKEPMLIAGAGHDYEKDLGCGLDEEASARFTIKQMETAGVFTADEISKVRRIIIGTTVHFEDGVLHQSPPEDDYPAQLVADADLSSLGKYPAIYWEWAVRFLKESTGNLSPTTSELAAFAASQERFLADHEFYTDEARELFPYKEDNVGFTWFMQNYYKSRSIVTSRTSPSATI